MELLILLTVVNIVCTVANVYVYSHLVDEDIPEPSQAPIEHSDLAPTEHSDLAPRRVEVESSFPHVWIVEAKWYNGNSKTFGNFDESYRADDLARSMLANDVGDYVEINEIDTAGIVIDTIIIRGTP
jgi:hypothetical protein|tara:strand:- start:321 stop:701 length:381 start_codon:yes stop_codon:yes gene_type:complete